MSVAQKITGFVVLFTTALPLVVFMFFMGQQKCIRWQMEEKLEEEQLTSVSISKQDLKWYKEGKEIIINGHLFDVKSISKLDNDQLLITGLFDYQEQKLHKELDKLMSNSESSSNTNQLTVLKWLSYLYDDNISSQVFYTNDFKSLEVRLSNTAHYSRLALNVLTPPPRVMFC